ncbi:hypothetical protein HG531_006076 [Fusarium graminearum]|nr:hypothetical protein HG531_006076 [Fusarium graminearum]
MQKVRNTNLKSTSQVGNTDVLWDEDRQWCSFGGNFQVLLGILLGLLALSAFPPSNCILVHIFVFVVVLPHILWTLALLISFVALLLFLYLEARLTPWLIFQCLLALLGQ